MAEEASEESGLPGISPIGPPPDQAGSGQWAVYDHDLGQFVSGVGDKTTANRAKKDLAGLNGAITDGHKLEVREV